MPQLLSATMTARHRCPSDSRVPLSKESVIMRGLTMLACSVTPEEWEIPETDRTSGHRDRMRTLMRRLICAIGFATLVVSSYTPASAQQRVVSFRVLSWNVSGDMPVKQPENFRGHLQMARPDIVLLDEVQESLTPDSVRTLFGGEWHLLWGERGGRQRIVILARWPLTALDAFQKNTYPETDRKAVLDAVPVERRAEISRMLSFEIPVNGGLLQPGGRKLLVVAADLMCCASEQWEELLRLAESREIRRLVDQAITAQAPDGVIVAGDFNLATPPAGRKGTGVLPLVVLSGPYPPPVHGLIAAEAVHQDGHEVWTIHNSDKSPFPAMPFDFQLYSPQTLRVVNAYVLDTADYPASELERVGLKPTSSAEFSNHRPVVVTYEWQHR
jgi:exonuclease III